MVSNTRMVADTAGKLRTIRLCWVASICFVFQAASIHVVQWLQCCAARLPGSKLRCIALQAVGVPCHRADVPRNRGGKAQKGRRRWAERREVEKGASLHRPAHSRTGTGLAAATSTPARGSPLPHLHRGRARPCHICTGTEIPAHLDGRGSASNGLFGDSSSPRHALRCCTQSSAW